MGLFSNKYPYTDFHELNLDWILDEMSTVTSKLEEIEALAEELKSELAKIDAFELRVDALEKATSDLATIRANINTLYSLCDDLKKVDESQEVKISDIYSKIADIHSKIKSDYDDISNQFTAVYKYIDNKYEGVNIEWYQKYIQLQYLMNKLNTDLENKISDLSDKLDYYIAYATVDVFNPVAHKRLSFDDNNKQAYVDLRDLGMTYAELSARKLSFEKVKNAHWNYRTWATRGRKEVTHSDINLFSPISGSWTNWAEALSHAVGWFIGSLTYASFNHKEYTYQQLEDLNLTFTDLMLLDASGHETGATPEPIYMSGALIVDGKGEPLTYGKLNRTVETL